MCITRPSQPCWRPSVPVKVHHGPRQCVVSDVTSACHGLSRLGGSSLVRWVMTQAPDVSQDRNCATSQTPAPEVALPPPWPGQPWPGQPWTYTKTPKPDPDPDPGFPPNNLLLQGWTHIPFLLRLRGSRPPAKANNIHATQTQQNNKGRQNNKDNPQTHKHTNDTKSSTQLNSCPCAGMWWLSPFPGHTLPFTGKHSPQLAGETLTL